MATPEELQAKLDAVEAEKKALENKVQVLSNGQADLDTLQKRIIETETKNKQLEEEHNRMKLDTAKAEVLKEFPGAAAFPEFLTGKTKEELATQAKTINERVEAGQKAAAEAKQKELEAQFGKINFGASGLHMNDDDIAAEYKKNQESHNPLGMLKAMFKRGPKAA